MIEIDCRKCSNCTGAACVIYGNDPDKAVKDCAADGFKNYAVRVDAGEGTEK